MKKRAKRAPKGMAVRKTDKQRPHVINAESKGLRVNAIECPKCADVIYSRARHDYRACKCGEVAIDGGFDYIKVAFKNKPPKEMEVWVSVSIKDLYQDWNAGTDKYGRVIPERGDVVSPK